MENLYPIKWVEPIVLFSRGEPIQPIENEIPAFQSGNTFAVKATLSDTSATQMCLLLRSG